MERQSGWLGTGIIDVNSSAFTLKLQEMIDM